MKARAGLGGFYLAVTNFGCITAKQPVMKEARSGTKVWRLVLLQNICFRVIILLIAIIRFQNGLRMHTQEQKYLDIRHPLCNAQRKSTEAPSSRGEFSSFNMLSNRWKPPNQRTSASSTWHWGNGEGGVILSQFDLSEGLFAADMRETCRERLHWIDYLDAVKFTPG